MARTRPDFGPFAGRHARHLAAVAEHGDAVGDGEDLVELVGDVDDGGAARGEAVERWRTARAPRGCVSDDVGSSRMSTRGVGRDALDDLDELALGDAEMIDLGRRIDGDAALGEGARAPARHRAGTADEARKHAALGSRPRKMFSATVSSGRRLSSWWTSTMPSARALRRRRRYRRRVRRSRWCRRSRRRSRRGCASASICRRRSRRSGRAPRRRADRGRRRRRRASRRSSCQFREARR